MLRQVFCGAVVVVVRWAIMVSGSVDITSCTCIIMGYITVLARVSRPGVYFDINC